MGIGMYDEDFVEFYELEHENFTEDIHLYQSYTMMTSGPILELGCGTGRVMHELVRAGHMIVGIDSSSPMLARARAKLADAPPQKWQLLERDMADLSGLPTNHFGLAFCALNTWAHLIDPDHARRTLQALRTVVTAAALLIIDLEDPEGRFRGRGEVFLSGLFHQGENTITKQVASSYDPVQGVDNITVIWDKSGVDGMQRAVVNTTLRPYSYLEMESMLISSGFKVREKLGSWDLTPYEAQSDRMILICEPVPVG